MSDADLSVEAMDDGPRALAEALSAEHAAVYGYEFLGGAGGDDEYRSRALEAALTHKELRDELYALAAAHDAEPSPALASYPLPKERDEASLDAFALGLEESTVRAYLWLTAARDIGMRTTGARNLQDATLRVLERGGELTALPGFDGG
ncbi:ferritin-like domain-containing protein [Nocardiopsis sp. N85]|uniref:ferritin-like domain-containing protein n=1 Tax=Nocardiopsis sp. N85 TaxID=3029400 RepID=UPI00237F73DF|nr:ferritin-like domain-containing protein [Nocardiopsis sp. N85]MDE3721263.1 ferritin-like domain-containing protein [Nocardiopsis sp. N85]